jgi:hypothetical protein
MPIDLTRTARGLHDRRTNRSHRIADSGPCQGHPCDDCATCRGGTCCGTLPMRIYRDGNPALSPEPYRPPTAEPGGCG